MAAPGHHLIGSTLGDAVHVTRPGFLKVSIAADLVAAGGFLAQYWLPSNHFGARNEG
jgi:hypothetical protein